MSEPGRPGSAPPPRSVRVSGHPRAKKTHRSPPEQPGPEAERPGPGPSRAASLRPWRRMGVLLAAGMLVLLFTTVYPFRQLRAGEEQLDRSRVVLEQRQDERVPLERRAQLLRTAAEIERLARARFGLAKPGESVFVVVEEQP